MKRSLAIGLGVAAVAVLTAGAVVLTKPAGAQPMVTVYKTPD